MSHFKRFVAALYILVCAACPVAAQQATLDDLFARLHQPDQPDWEQVEQQIWQSWSRSGSPTADLLLERGRAAIDAGDLPRAIFHLTALIENYPGFAEGYNARATAYYQAGMYGPSLADIESTLALNPRHFGALMGLALIFEELDKDREALSAYRAVAAIHPHRPDVKDAIARLEKGLEGTAL